MRNAQTIVGAVLLLLLAASGAYADEDLDAELDAEWGSSRVKTVTVQTPEAQYRARLELLRASRDAQLERCKAKGGGSNYCQNYINEQYRRDERALAAEFGDTLDESARERRRIQKSLVKENAGAIQ